MANLKLHLLSVLCNCLLLFWNKIYICGNLLSTKDKNRKEKKLFSPSTMIFVGQWTLNKKEI